MFHIQQELKTSNFSPALNLERAVARCIIADTDGGELPPHIAPYWLAFKSDFSHADSCPWSFGRDFENIATS